MKLRCIFALAACIATTASWAQPKSLSKPVTDVGRYQLFQGEYTFVNVKGEQFREKALFKIDTSTGELFVCSGSQYDGKQFAKQGQMVQRHECKPFERELVTPLER